MGGHGCGNGSALEKERNDEEEVDGKCVTRTRGKGRDYYLCTKSTAEPQ